MKIKAFTLAEVLITLLIIGVVAALTVPSVIVKAEQMQFKTGLKKAVAVLNESIQTNIALEGETPYDAKDLFDYIKRHMSVISSDAYASRGNKHFYTTDGMRFDFPSYVFDMHPSEKILLHESGLSAMDGKIKSQTCTRFGCSVSESSNYGYCGSYGLSNNPNNTTTTPCVVMVDINGEKKPSPQEYSVHYDATYWANGDIMSPAYDLGGYYRNVYPMPNDKKLTDVFNILITDEKAIPFGVVAQRAMYSK